MNVYIVIIGHTTKPTTAVGACYTLEAHAEREVKRLLASSRYIRAYYVRRTVEEHCGKAPLVGWGHE